VNSVKRILTINFGGIGDEILFLPTLKTLRMQLPEAHFTLLLEPRSRSVKEVTDLIDEVLTFDIKKRPLLPQDLLSLLLLIRKGAYDLVLSSGSSPMVAMLLYLSGIKVRVGYDAGSKVKALLTHPVKLNREQYAGNMYHDLCKGVAAYLGKKSDEERFQPSYLHVPEIVVKAESLKAMKQVISNFNLPEGEKPPRYILLHPGTSRLAVEKGIIKTWPTAAWLSLIEQIEETKELPFKPVIVLCGGPDDASVMGDLLKGLGNKYGDNLESRGILNAYGKTRSLSDLAALISLSDLMVCVDSAPMHLAVGLNKKVVALFGPLEPEKLIPPKANFVAIADRPERARPDEFSPISYEASSQIRSLLDGLGVRLPPDIVYRSSLDLLMRE
jgi:ADP-heptose:LPS heptosyltransferase